MAKKKEVKQQTGSELRNSLKGDDAFTKYRRMVKTIGENVDLETAYKEVMQIHSGRLITSLYGTTPGADKIVQAVTQEVRSRSRLVSLVLKATRHHDRLDIMIDEMRKYLALTYADHTPALRTKQERMTYFDKYLTRGIELKHELKSFIEASNQIIKDIDQASHATRHLVSCLELVLNHNNDKSRAA